MGVIVLAENKGDQVAVFAEDGQGVELVIPDDVVGSLQAGAFGGRDDLFGRSHELGNRGGGIHAADAVITAGDNAQELAGAGAVISDGHGGVASTFLHHENICQGVVQAEVGVTGDKAGLVCLHLADHLSLLFNGLGDEDKGNTALFGKANTHLLTRDGLHNSRNHGDIHSQGTLFLTFAVLHNGSLQRNVGGDAVSRGVTGDKQILAEGTGGFREEISHNAPHS